MKFVCKLAVLVWCAAMVCAACSSFEKAKERFDVDIRGERFAAGTADMEFDNVFSKARLSKQDVSVFYFPDDDAVCLQFRHNFTNYYQFWNRTNRNAFAAALGQYKLDYGVRNLTNSNMRTKRIYGAERAYLIWESTQYSIQGISHPGIEIGYQFKNNAPYFSVNMREELNEDHQTSATLEKNSAVTYYFTRAQADALAALLDQEYLDSLSPIPAAVEPAAEPDTEPAGELYTEGDF